MTEWSVTEPQKLTFDEPVDTLSVRIVNGTVNVVGTEDASAGARLEVTEIDGPPLVVTLEGGTLTVTYEDLPWKSGKGFLSFLDRQSWHRTAAVTLAVPAAAKVSVGVVGASAVVSGIRGRTDVRGVTGDTTLVGLTGKVNADTVSGNLEAHSLTGDLHFKSVSGDLTMVDGAGSSVRAESVGGAMVIDVDPARNGPADIALTTVSGEVAIRLPHPADAKVEANTTSGQVSSAFEDLRISGQWAQKKITGTLGTGAGKLRATTVSGSIALLRRPPTDDLPVDDLPVDDAPTGDAPLGGAPKDTPSAPSDSPSGKVL
ncbi:DUF4097 family beta strand repeat-containing protein [Streptomyces sp. NBC_00237]|uniref:DUF4097 family beta strand repeat-containing protein n=1 Tax=Streptomyces sp. NBC_00237 TaxID=2975687 RepID=UPI0022567B8F|nr:DUF4097 family beta strand repeat-containing protein [Streptomyces sp. NBC_00237]MCX5204268.1 DUF4097 family beta strand repeat-containing protein [Streptomyces sp. NBC_00237]